MRTRVWTALSCLLFSWYNQTYSQDLKTDLVLLDSLASNQDDMCIWIHPSDPAQSTIITSDKDSNFLFIYDLAGNTLQSLAVPGSPGNVDVRYGFPIANDRIDIVAFNDHDNNQIEVYQVDTPSRKLTRIDNGAIASGPSYGFCLYRSPVTGKYYALKTHRGQGTILQIELFAEADRVAGRLVREWFVNSRTESCVCDDETGLAYYAEEDVGIWRIDAEPDSEDSPQLIATVGDSSGLAADVEGLTIYYSYKGEGYLLASSQGASKFTIFERKAPHRPVGEFSITGVKSTDGIDVTNIYLNDEFSQGVFVYSMGGKRPHEVGVSRWDRIADGAGGLIIDAESWDPRAASRETAVDDGQTKAPVSFSLAQNYPNPFNPVTTITFDLAQGGRIRLSIVNVLGQRVRTLIDGFATAGHHQASWDGRDASGASVAGGVYLYRLDQGDQTVTKKLMFIK